MLLRSSTKNGLSSKIKIFSTFFYDFKAAQKKILTIRKKMYFFTRKTIEWSDFRKKIFDPFFCFFEIFFFFKRHKQHKKRKKKYTPGRFEKLRIFPKRWYTAIPNMMDLRMDRGGWSCWHGMHHIYGWYSQNGIFWENFFFFANVSIKKKFFEFLCIFYVRIKIHCGLSLIFFFKPNFLGFRFFRKIWNWKMAPNFLKKFGHILWVKTNIFCPVNFLAMMLRLSIKK